MLAVTLDLALWVIGALALGVAAIGWLLSGRVQVVPEAEADERRATASASAAGRDGASGSGRRAPTPAATPARRGR